MSSGLFSSGKKKSRRRVQIPDFLQPFINQATGAASSALGRLQSLSEGDLVAAFSPEQEQAFDLAVNRARGAGGFIPTAQNELLRTARGVPVSDFVDPGAFGRLSAFGDSSGIPPGIERALRRLTRGVGDPTQTGAIGEILDTDFVPEDATGRLLSATGAGPVNADEIDRILQGEIIPAGSREALTATAAGDFLAGGPGFDEAVDAAVRRALPQIQTVFGSAGAGGATGGLAQEAVGQAAIDAFASQFSRERDRQLQASGALADLGVTEAGVRLGAQGQREGQELARAGQGIGAAEILAELGLGETGIRLDTLRGLEADDLARTGLRTQTGLASTGLLADLFTGEQGRALEASGLLAGLSADERGRALDATRFLPEAGLLDVNLLEQVGEARQGQAQRELSAPIDLQQIILAAALGGLPIESLLGENIRGRSRGFSLGFGQG